MRTRDTDAAWRGDKNDPPTLRWKLHPHQKVAYNHFHAAILRPKNRICWRWSRRLGKTHTAETIACEFAVSRPGVRVVVVADTEKMLAEFIRPAIELICSDAPPEMKPAWRASEGRYVFPNGSQICLYGASSDAAIDNIGRGPAADAVIFEEAGHIHNLQKAVRVVSPQLLSTRHKKGHGWILFVGTPPESTAHFFVKLCQDAQKEGREVHYTVWQGHMDEKTVLEQIANDAVGMPVEEYMKTEDYRREFLGELIGDPTRKVLKLADEKRLAECVERYKTIRRPAHCAVYEALDVGWGPDWSFWLMGWWDYNTRTLVVEREWYMREGMRPDDLGTAVKAIETEVLGPSRTTQFHIGSREPSRWSDYSPVLLAEVADKHGLVFSHTAKDDRDTAISNCDRMVAGYGSVGKLAINPDGCPELLKQMLAAMWNKQRTEFAKDDPKRYGHYDGVAALVYLTRNVQRDENPFPPNYVDLNRNTHFVIDEPDLRSPALATWQNAFGFGDDYGL